MKILLQDLFAYEYDNGKQFLFASYNDYFANLSHVSLIESTGDRIPPLMSYLGGVADEYDELVVDIEDPIELSALFVVLGLVVKKYLTCPRPFKILEMGCSQGVLSYFLAQSARIYHEQNKVCLLSDLLYNNTWARIISQLGEAVQNVSVITADVAGDILPDDYFDIVIINGTDEFADPAALSQNALRVTRNGGDLICYTHGNKALKQGFVRHVSSYQEMPVTAANGVLFAHILSKAHLPGYRSPKDQLAEQKEQMRKLYGKIRPLLDDLSACSEEELSGLVQNLDALERMAIELFAHIEDLTLKNRLNLMKENVLNYLYTSMEDQKELCRSSCHALAISEELIG